MNITILSLFSSSLISGSPSFVGNDLSMINSGFKKFTSILFLNQQNLLLKGTNFIQGLSSVIHNTNSNNNIQFYQKNFNTLFRNHLNDEDNNKSVSVMECTFDKVIDDNDNTIRIKDITISLYITDTLFRSCYSKDGILGLQSCRCLTMTHTCSFESKCQFGCGFINYQCKKEDFSIFTYNTIVSSTKVNGETYDIYCDYGDQYYRCVNISNGNMHGFKFNSQCCFSFAFVTAMNYNGRLFTVSGYEDSSVPIYSKTMEKVNFFNYGQDYLLYLGSGQNYVLTIKDSVLMNTDKDKIAKKDDSKNGVTLVLDHCLLPSWWTNEADATQIECTYDDFSTKHLTLLPHYTNGVECVGPVQPESTKAHNCAVGNCLDNICNKTIAFPPGVPQYTTLIYLDIQTASFSPSKLFSKSDMFSHSDDFTQSMKFTKSDNFKDSSTFSESKKFSKSSKFSNSKMFSESSKFSESDIFTLSLFFTELNKLIKSDEFTDSSKFTSSNMFSQSNLLPSKIFNGMKDNQGGEEKGINKTMIGVIAGVIAAVAVIAVAAIFIIRRHKKIPTSDPGLIESLQSSLTTKNTLGDIMDEDDPFANEFRQ